MPLYLDQLLDDMFTNRVVKKVVQNPILTAIIIVLIFVIIAHFMFYDSDDDSTTYAKTLIRFGVYGFVGSLAVIFLHYKNTEDDYQKRVYGKTESDIMREVQQVNGAMDEAQVEEPIPEKAEPIHGAQEGLQPVTPAQTAIPASVPIKPAEPRTNVAPQVQVIVQQPAPKPTPPRPALRTPVHGK
jgi:hypothetical protein